MFLHICVFLIATEMYFGRCTMLAPVSHRTCEIRCVGFVIGKKGVLNVAGYFYLTSLALASINHLKVRTR